MAAVMSDFADSSRFHHGHSAIVTAGRERSPSSSSSPYSHRSSRRTDHPPTPGSHHAPIKSGTPPPSAGVSAVQNRGSGSIADQRSTTSKSGPPSPPSSSSPSMESYPARRFPSQENLPASSTQAPDSPHIGFADAKADRAPQETIPRSTRSLDDVQRYGGNTIKVRDLAHIQSFATEEFLSHRGAASKRRGVDEPVMNYEISGMPITDIIEMVAGLLTKITTTNDRQHETLNRPLPTGDASLTAAGYSSSVLAFHGKNVPSITIVSYLARIHKYCPTTYEVFLSLLVYFDRMTERVNAGPMQALRRNSDLMEQDVDNEPSSPATSYSADGSDLADSPPPSRSAPESSADLQNAQYSHNSSREEGSQFPLSHFFVVDSFNIHRLVISGVTCASKFFSDVFYTNSRYAKVGGLPLVELNHLELQFLLLNDFRLSVPVEELEAYGTMLVEFYAREIIAQRKSSNSEMSYHAEGSDLDDGN